MNIVKIFLFSSLVFLLPLTSHSVDCDKLFKEKGFLCVGWVGKGKWKNLEFTYKTSRYDKSKIVINVTNDSSTNYKDIEFHFGYYDENGELLKVVTNSYYNDGYFAPNSENQLIIDKMYEWENMRQYIKYIKIHRVSDESGFF